MKVGLDVGALWRRGVSIGRLVHADGTGQPELGGNRQGILGLERIVGEMPTPFDKRNDPFAMEGEATASCPSAFACNGGFLVVPSGHRLERCRLVFGPFGSGS
jgi:hypothetical protein